MTFMFAHIKCIKYIEKCNTHSFYKLYSLKPIVKPIPIIIILKYTISYKYHRLAFYTFRFDGQFNISIFTSHFTLRAGHTFLTI